MELMHKRGIILAVFASALLGGAFAQGKHQRFDFGFVKVEAVEAGYNRMHNPSECVGSLEPNTTFPTTTQRPPEENPLTENAPINSTPQTA